MEAWTFGRKVGLGFAVVVVLTLLVCIVSVYALRSVATSKDQALTVFAEDLAAAEGLRTLHFQRSAANRAFLLTGVAEDLSRHEDAADAFEGALEGLREHTSRSAELRAAHGTLERAYSDYSTAVREVGRMRTAGASLEETIRRFDAEVDPKSRVVADALLGLVSAVHDDARASAERADRVATMATWVVVGLAGLVVLAATGIALVLTRSLTTQIGSAVHHMESSSAELTATATQQASGAREQATAMTEVASSITELLASSRQIADGAQRVSRIAVETSTAARNGDAAVRGAEESVQAIRKQVDVIVEHMLDLGRRSQQIGGILEIIDELAEQTNILAINATIEAAGAGESGRRFAVVSDEIRKLADRVGGSTREIGSLLDGVRAAVNSTVMATESGAKTVEGSAQRFGALTDAFRRIGELVQIATDAAREIELSTKQQSTAVEQVNIAVSNVAQAAREAEVGTVQTVQTASELTSLSSQLTRLVTSKAA